MSKCSFIIKFFIWFANRTPKAKEFMKNWNSIIQFNLNGKEIFHIEIKDGRASFYESEHKNPSVFIKSDQKTFFKILKGELDPQEAYLFHKYEIEGSIKDGTKFKWLSRIVQDSHKRLFSLAQSILK